MSLAIDGMIGFFKHYARVSFFSPLATIPFEEGAFVNIQNTCCTLCSKSTKWDLLSQNKSFTLGFVSCFFPGLTWAAGQMGCGGQQHPSSLFWITISCNAVCCQFWTCSRYASHQIREDWNMCHCTEQPVLVQKTLLKRLTCIHSSPEMVTF